MKQKLIASMLSVCICMTAAVPAYAADDSAAGATAVEKNYETAESEEPERPEETEADKTEETEIKQTEETADPAKEEKTENAQEDAGKKDGPEEERETKAVKEEDSSDEEEIVVTTEDIETEKEHEKQDWAAMDYDEETGIYIMKEGFSVKEGQEIKLKKEDWNEKVGNYQITWKSSDESIISIRDGYTAVCKKTGHATLTGQTKINGKIYDCAEYELFVLGAIKDFSFTKVKDNIIRLEKNDSVLHCELVTDPQNAVIDDGLIYKGKTFEMKGSIQATTTRKSMSVDIRGNRPGWEYADITIYSNKKPVTKRFLVITGDTKAEDVIKLGKTSLTLEKGKGTGDAKVTSCGYEKGKASVKTWSTNSDVAAVDPNRPGIITPKKGGTAYIKFMFGDNKDTTKTCKVTVIAKASKVKLDRTAVKLINGKTKQLKAEVLPTDTTNKAVIWTSSNTKVATVSQTGVVKAVGKGTATIKCTTKDGTKLSASCSVTVSDPVKKITLSKTSVSILSGRSINLAPTISPASAGNKEVKWASSNTKVAKVDSKGRVTAVDKGKAVITCTAADGSGVKASYNVTVSIPVKKITLDKTKMTLKKGKTYTFKVAVAPSNATNKGVIWKSNNEKVVSVTQTGKITAKKSGKAIISCTAKDGSGSKVICVVTCP